MKRLLLALLLAAGILTACGPPPPNDVQPGTPAEWVHDSLAGFPELQEEMRGTNHAIADLNDYPPEWVANAFILGNQTGIRWRNDAPTWRREFQLDIAAHEAAHIMAYRRWGTPWPPEWATNGYGWGSAESYADCLASYLRNRIVIGHGGCVGNPADAYRLLIETPPKAGIR